MRRTPGCIHPHVYYKGDIALVCNCESGAELREIDWIYEEKVHRSPLKFQIDKYLLREI